MSEQLAILGGKPTRTEPYPEWPVHDERDIEAVTSVIRSGNWGGYPYPGPRTQEFCRRFAELHGAQYAVAMANGTITIEVALRAAGVGWGDEVIVPAYTFQATATAPMAAGAIPVIVDIDRENYCLDPKAVEAAITPRTRAIIPVHIGAQMTDMDAIMEIAERHNLIVVEDCAHAHGAQWRGRGVGTIGHFGSFSLQSSKTLTSGEGGILICRTKELAERATSIIDCGRPHDEKGERSMMGANFRMSELACALATVGLERFPQQFREREEMAAYLDESLSEIPGVRLLRHDERQTARSVYCYIFAIEPEKFGAAHDVVCEAMNAEGIPCWEGYPPMHQYDLFQPQRSRLPVPSAFPERFDFGKMHFPQAETAHQREAVWMPEQVLRAGRQGVDDVVNALKKVRETLHNDSGAAERIRKASSD